MQNNNDDKDKLMDHEYDSIRELDNHMPRWWVLGFYFTIAFAAVYLVYYHVAGGPSSDQEYQAEMKASPQQKAAIAKVEDTGLKVLTDAGALAAGAKLYTSQTCSACHGPELAGLVGPNLTDDFWIHGCDLTTIMGNIRKGFQQKGMMPFGNGKPLNDDELLKLVSFILSKKGSNPANAKAIDPEREKKCSAKS